MHKNHTKFVVQPEIRLKLIIHSVFVTLKLHGGRSTIGCGPPHRPVSPLLIVRQAISVPENSRG